MKNDKKETIAVVGLGYVGLPLALLASKKGYRVVGIDKDETKVGKLAQRLPTYVDKKVESELKRSELEVTTDFKRVEETSIVIICVPTPVYADHMPNLEPVRDACKGIAPYLKEGHLVILESTVNPGVSEGIVVPILESLTKMKVSRDFYLAHCPERINPGDKKWNVENIPRVVGSLDEVGLKKAKAFYESILDAKVKKMNSIKEAEAVKIVENSFRDINIAFVNELARSFDRLGIDAVNVIDGAATKPFAFMAHYPGCGVGGHCIPVDPYYLIEYAKQNGFEHRFLSLARTINNDMPKFTVELLVKGLLEKNLSLAGTKVAVLGLAYKGDIDDCRESPSFEIIKHLKEEGALVSVFDPFVKNDSSASTLEEAIKDAQAVVIATAHSPFKKLSPDFFIKNNIGVVVDGRNCLPEGKFISAGIIYKGIGKRP